MRILMTLLVLMPLVSQGQWIAISRMSSGKGTTVVTNSIRGHVELKNGELLTGKVQLKILNEDTIEVRIVPRGEKKKQKYPRSQVASFSGVVLLQDMKNDYKKPYKNFHPGKLFLEDGSEKEGKIAMGMREASANDGSKIFGPVRIKYANADDEVTIEPATQTDIIYAIQTIGGTDYHYIKVGRQFVSVGNPTGRFSYFRNPKPTHVREGTTNLTKSAVEQVGQELAESAAEAAAKKSFEETQKSGGNLGESIGNATVAAANSAQLVNDVFTLEDDGAIYFEEYYVVDNEKMTSSIIYKKNVEEVLSKLLEGCRVGQEKISQASDFKELTKAMIFLEENKCD